MRKVTVIILICFSLSCSQNENKVKSENDVTMKYEKIELEDHYSDNVMVTTEIYVSQKKDTFLNQQKIFENSVLNKKLSKYYEFSVNRRKKDTVFRGSIKIFSPADSISKSQISEREVTLIFLQENKDSVYWKEVKSKTNIISFEYQNFDSLNFVGYISDLRFFKIDSLEDKLLLNRNFFAIDSRTTTNNPFVELLKE
jgi:hypothetical protein